jgi:zinc transport system substrate-binding protein
VESVFGLRKMARGRVGWAILALLSLALFLVPGACAETPQTGSGVVTTIFPLADFVTNVAGEGTKVMTLLPPGASPHTYDLTPKQVREAVTARLMVVNGAGLDFWMEDEIRSAAGESLLVVDTSAGPAIENLLIWDARHETANPHIWLDPVLAEKQVQAIAEALIMVDPDNRDSYIERAAAYLDELKALDQEIANTVKDFSIRQFISLHPAWTYFAQRYGLVEAAVIEESPGQEPSPAYVAEVVDLARELGIKVIFAEPELPTIYAESIARESGAEVILLDPIGGPDLEGRGSYVDLMRYNLNLMREAML